MPSTGVFSAYRPANRCRRLLVTRHRPARHEAHEAGRCRSKRNAGDVVPVVNDAVMGIIRPQNDDGAGRWAIVLNDAGVDGYLIGTRTSILDATRVLTDRAAPHSVYRRPGTSSPWQLVSTYPTVYEAP